MFTCIYYTSNKEGEMFEGRIQNHLKSVCPFPIISVSHKPIELGKNIVVGDVGVSGFNMFRQVQIACREAKTPFVISCEADTLYPPDYFTYIPKNYECYRDSNLYVMGQWREYFYKKSEGATHAQIVGREYYLSILDKLFKDAPDWSIEERNFPKERFKKNDVFDKINYWESKNPVVQIKTTRSMRHYTHSDRTPIYTLPYWGNGKEFRNKYYADN